MLKDLRIGLLLTVCLFSACASEPDNFEGKNFDANSSYCQKLWRSATMVYQTNPNFALSRSTATNPQSMGARVMSQTERDATMRGYNIDCESISAYSLRTTANK